MSARQGPVATGAVRVVKKTSALRMLRRDKGALLSAIFLAIAVVACTYGALFLRSAATTQDLANRLTPPGLGNGIAGLLGTDQLGRSVFYRLLVAGATSLEIAVSAAVIAAVIGGMLGIVAGYLGGWVQSVAMRVADVIMSFPSLLLAIFFLYVFDPSPVNIVILLVIAHIPLYLRVGRAETLEAKQRLFVDASRSLGASNVRIITIDIFPVIAPTLLTLAALDVGLLMLVESALSFLGIGIQPPSVSWGVMVSDGRELIASAWWLTVFPGLAITLVALSANLLANWLRVVTNPVQRWRLEGPTRPSAAVALQDLAPTTKAVV